MKNDLKSRLQAALWEDIQKGDITSEFLIPQKATAHAKIIAKEAGVFSGASIPKLLFQLSGGNVSLKLCIREGQNFKSGQTLIKFYGNLRSILAVERLLLNLLQHLCGIATQTRAFVNKIKPYKVKILDTRKTTPLWRDLEKAAVKAGGGMNHRMGLYDALFVKENHRRFGDIQKLKARSGNFEIEARSFSEALQALKLQPEVILFDNFSVPQLRSAVQKIRKINPKIILEASGGITLKNVAQYAKAGVDQISVGALTHSVKAIDLSLLVE